MIFSKKNKDGNIAINLSYIDGIINYKKDDAVQLSIDSNNQCITIIGRLYKRPVIHLPLNQINNVAIVDNQEIEEKSKNVIGRAVTGGIILGPLGAIIGGTSGIGNKKVLTYKKYLVINYISKNAEMKVISFEIVGATLHLNYFLKELKSKANIQETNQNEISL